MIGRFLCFVYITSGIYRLIMYRDQKNNNYLCRLSFMTPQLYIFCIKLKKVKYILVSKKSKK